MPEIIMLIIHVVSYTMYYGWFLSFVNTLTCSIHFEQRLILFSLTGRKYRIFSDLFWFRVIHLRYVRQLCYSIHADKCMIFLFFWGRLKLNSDRNFEI